MKEKRLIAPSLLAADFTDIKSGVKLAEKAGAEWLHLDVMDGSFVPPITFGSQMVQAIRSLTDLLLDTHLMVVDPASQLDFFAIAGVDRLTFHIETEIHATHFVQSIRDAGMSPGIAIEPETPVSAISGILDIVDQVLVMTVNPGYGGQELIRSTLNKIETLVRMREKGAGNYLVAMDGGFCSDTAGMVWSSGVDIAVMGTAFFHAHNPVEIFNQCKNMELQP